MNFLLDENFPKSVAPILTDLGHNVFDFRDIGIQGSDDKVVIETAIEYKAIILTTDRDFFHTLSNQYPDHFGIIVIALKHPTRTAITEKLLWILNKLDSDDFKGRAFQLRNKVWMSFPSLENKDFENK